MSEADIARMRDQLFFEGPAVARKQSRFWMLLVLSAVIASAGVVGDSTATVIGAMIVAPLMTPILGIVLGIALADRRNLGRSILYVVAGALLVIAIGFVVGEIVRVPVVELTNAQVAARVSPRLIDLLAALATGAVGAFALCRSDISDTLPGVAIAISLVPPLAVVGLTLESGAPDQAAGALLLFVTNVAAILATGVIVVAIYGVHDHGELAGVAEHRSRLGRKPAIAAIAALVVIVAIPLATTSFTVARATLDVQGVDNVASTWARDAGWDLVSVSASQGDVIVRALGTGTPPDPARLRSMLDAEGLRHVDVEVQLVPETRVLIPGA